MLIKKNENGESYEFWLIVQFIFEVTRDGSFNYGHWLFSFTYIASAIEMPYIFKKETVSEKTEKCKNTIFWVVTALNFLSVIGYAIIVYADNNYTLKTGENLSPARQQLYLGMKFSVGGMQLVSGVVLVVSIFMIRQFLVAHGLADEVNDKAMFLHGLSFSLYIASVVAYDYYYYVYIYFSREDAQRDALIAWIITTYMSFLAQIFLAIILYQLGQTKQRQESVEDFTSDGELTENQL